MAGPRLLAPNAGKQLAAGARQTRQLHITGAATYPSRFLTSSKPNAVVSKDSKHQIESERPLARRGSIEESKRHFNTSRSLKAVNDSSTIDFAYLPDTSVLMAAPPEEIRVPILPHQFFPSRNTKPIDEIVPVPRPEISLASADSTHVSMPSAMSELSDTGLHMDFDAMAEKFTGAAEKIADAAGVDAATKEEVVKKAQGMVQQVWKGLLEDVFGQRNDKQTKA